MNQESCFEIQCTPNDIAVDSESNIYLTAENHIYKYNSQGQLIKDMVFSDDPEVSYTSICIKSGTVYAAYNGSQTGFSIRDTQLNQQSTVEVDYQISGICAGASDTVYLTSDNIIYHCKTDGTVIKKMVFPEADIQYTDISSIV